DLLLWSESGVNANNYIEEVSNGLHWVGLNAGNLFIYQTKLTSGRYYKISVDCVEHTSGAIQAYCSTTLNGSVVIDGVGGFSGILKATDGVFYLQRQAAGDQDMVIRSITLEEVPEGYPLMDKGMKYLECTSAGTVAFPSDQAYGEWEFDLYNYDNTTQIGIDFITNGSEKYTLYLTSSERIALYRAAAISQTAADFISFGIWYRIKLTRTLDGEFTFYVRGGEFGNDDWTLVLPVSTTNPFTDNTYTESQYFVVDLDVGDRIANLITRKAVQQ
ncbi:unnamed protein product, partial [marine sediment metagenome]